MFDDPRWGDDPRDLDEDPRDRNERQCDRDDHENVEVVTIHYRGAHGAATARSGFTTYRGSSARIGGGNGSGRYEVATSVRLERIELFSRYLARDLARTSTRRTSLVHRAMADAIQTEIAAVVRALNRPTRRSC